MEGYNPQDFSFFHRGWKISTTIENIQEEINLMVAKEKAAKLAKAACPVNIEPYRQGIKWGLRDSNGRVVVPPIYRSINAKYDYYTFENLPLHWGIMDKNGKVLVEPKHDKVEITSDGKAIMTTITGKQTVVNLKSPQK